MPKTIRVSKTWFRAMAAVAAVVLLSGCASFPPIETGDTVSVETNFPTYQVLAVDVEGDPASRPGRAAVGALGGSTECGYLFLVCAIVAVPAAAATGAVITAIETLPEHEAHELNRVTADIMAGINLEDSLTTAMHEEAVRQGLVLSYGQADTHLSIFVSEFTWIVSAGNNVSIRMNFNATGSANGKNGIRTMSYRSEKASVPDWVAKNGERIRQTLDTIAEEASREIWAAVVERDE